MCDENSKGGALQRVIATLSASGASGIAKASPGIAVTGAGVLGFPLETWVTILTCLYLLFMLIGAMPKVVEAIRYLYRLAKTKTRAPVNVTEIPDPSVNQKIEKAKHE